MTKQLTVMDEVRGAFQRLEPQFKMALPPHIPAERFVRIVTTAVQMNQKLLDCSRQSLFAAAMQAAQQGLLPDGKEGAIIPYKEEARWMPMIGGILKKARNSGEISTMDADVVCENDKYRSWADEKGRHFEFEKARSDRGKPILTFAFAITKDGGFYFEEVSEEEMQKIESCSRANNSPWKGPFRDEMKKKSALRRLAKHRLPSSTDLDQVITQDDDMYDLEAPVEKSETQPQTKSSRLSKAVGEYRDTNTVNAVGNVEEKTNTVTAELKEEECPL